MAALYIIGLGLSYFSSKESFHVFVGMTATHVLFGRAAGMSFGYALNYGNDVVVPVNIAIETIMVLLFYPIFVFSVRHLMFIENLKSFMDHIHEIAQSNKPLIRRYGLPGLFAFVCFPFWLTGPLIGCVIGFLLGLHPWLNMFIVLGSTYFAALIWAIVLHEIHVRVAEFNPYAPLILVAVIIVLSIIGIIIDRMNYQRRKTAEDDSENKEKGKDEEISCSNLP